MSLKAKLIQRIAADGPMPLDAFMTACLHDPRHGYYATRPALGADGDFITAPLISQMFGELVGLWAVEAWTAMGRPTPFRLVEVGPGDGMLMTDLLRAARIVPDFMAAGTLWLVEPSSPLADMQRNRLAAYDGRWATSLDDVPPCAPIILIANEVLDCLPARQFVRTGAGWAERVVGLGEGGDLAFGLVAASEAMIPPALRNAAEGTIVEVSPAQARFGAALGARIAADGGAALLIDYGRDRAEIGGTLQALSRHRKVDPLAALGEADLTVHADFPAVAAAARHAGAAATPIVPQGAFLKALGIELRAAALAKARPERAETIGRQLHRLTAPDQMGELFKVLAIHTRGLALPGFDG